MAKSIFDGSLTKEEQAENSRLTAKGWQDEKRPDNAYGCLKIELEDL
jgi:hypothetical protein